MKLHPVADYIYGLFFLGIFTSYTAFASPILTSSAKASALGNAVTADVVGATSGIFNPATLTKVRTGKTGRYRELKLMALPFPDFTFKTVKPPEDRDPLRDATILLGEQITGPDMFAGDDPRDQPFEAEPDSFVFYLPGYGEVGETDADSIPFLLLPLFNNTYKSKDGRLAFTSAITAVPGGVKLKDLPWSHMGNSVSLGLLALNPNIAYQINEKWSIGFGVSWSALGAKVAFDYRQQQPTLFGNLQTVIDLICDAGASNSALASTCDNNALLSNDTLFNAAAEVEDLFNYSFNAGLLWSPTPWFSWGLNYRHQTKYKLEGDFVFTFSPSANNLAHAVFDDVEFLETFVGEGHDEVLDSDITINLTLPSQVSTGISVALMPRLLLNIDYHWKQSSVYNDIKIRWIDYADHPSGVLYASILLQTLTGTPVDTQNLGVDYSDVIQYQDAEIKDTGNFAYGLTYQFNERLKLRVGYENRASAYANDIPLGIPLDSMRVRGLGINYMLSHNSDIDITYVRLGMSGRTLAGEGILNSVDPVLTTHAIFAGSDILFDVNVQMLQIGYNNLF